MLAVLFPYIQNQTIAYKYQNINKKTFLTLSISTVQ